MAALMLPALACTSGPSTPDTPGPSPTPSGSPSGRAFAYVLESDGIHLYAVEAQTGTFSSIGVVPASNPVRLTLHPSGRFLFLAACKSLKACDVATYAIDAGSGGLTHVGQIPCSAGNPRRALTATPSLYVVIDDSSTGYAAGIDAYAVNGARGELTFLGRFFWRVGSYGSAPRLDSVELDAAGRFLWEVSRSPRPRIVTYAIAETGALSRVGEVDVAAAEPLEAAAHPSGQFVYAVAGVPGTSGSSLLFYRVAGDSGLLSLVGRTEARPVPSSPERLALHPTGRFLYLLNSSGIASYGIDAASGALQGIGQPRGPGRPGYLAVEPSGRFLYVSEVDTREVRAYAIDSQDGSLSEVGGVSAGGGDLAILKR